MNSSQNLILLASLLRSRGQKVAFAESCTGGLISARFAALAGVSDVYSGAVVAYSNAVKVRILGVSESLIRQVGAVSTSVAQEMANGVCLALGAQWSVSVTGVAGPSGGTVQKPVGTVCFGVSGPGVVWSTMMRFDGDRNAVQESSANFAIGLLNAALSAGLDGLNTAFGPRTGL